MEDSIARSYCEQIRKRKTAKEKSNENWRKQKSTQGDIMQAAADDINFS